MASIGHLDIGDRTGRDFDLARRKAVTRRVLAWLAGRPNRLLSFEEAYGAAGELIPTHAGIKPVEIRNIVGSIGRRGDFDRAFLPARPILKERWKRVDRAFCRSERLPPIRLSKVGDAYFVIDGNHRVSVARFHGVDWIDAEITELRDATPADSTGTGRKEAA